MGLAGCHPSAEPAAGPPALNVAFLHPASDADPAREGVVREFGARIRVETRASPSDEAATENQLRAWVKSGQKLIFAMTPDAGVVAAMRRVAADAPAVRFEQLGGLKPAQNLHVFEARTYEGAYLAGLVAGALSQSHALGVQVQPQKPTSTLEDVRIVNAFALGARTLEPRSVIRVAQKSQGESKGESERAISGHTGPGPGVDMVLRCAEDGSIRLERMGMSGVPLVTVTVDWSPYHRHAIQTTLAGTWEAEPGGATWWGLREDVVIVSLAAALPATLQQRVGQARDALRQGQAVIWRGPILGQDGKPVLRREEVAGDKFLHGMNFYVEGVEAHVSPVTSMTP